MNGGGGESRLTRHGDRALTAEIRYQNDALKQDNKYQH